MRWVAIFDDTPGMLAIRHEREALHLLSPSELG